MQAPPKYGEVLIRGYHVHAIAPNQHPVLRLQHLHLCGSAQEFGQHALQGRVQVLDHDEGHSALRRNIGEKLRQCLQPARRRPDSHNSEGLACRRAGSLSGLSPLTLRSFPDLLPR